MLILSILGFFVLIFLVAIITVAIAWMVFLREASEVGTAVGEGVGAEEKLGIDRAGAGFDETVIEDESPLFRNDRLSTLNFWDNLLTRFDFIEILKLRLAQAELDWNVGRVTLTMLLCGTIAFLLAQSVLPVWAAVPVGIAVAMAPYGYILRVRDRRFRKFQEVFPDVLDSLARALRAGYPLSAAFELVANETPAPVAAEMKKVAVEANLGMGWQRALENLGQRMPLLEVNLFGAAVTLHARTGGKLSEVMTGLAETMRESLALEGEVRALAAHGKLTGLILTILPIAIAIMMLIVSPNYMYVLYEHPMGKTLIAAAIACLVLAHFIIRKLVDIRI
ncbi:MAG: type II secretion system F family protein [Acidobacteriota bacterium]